MISFPVSNGVAIPPVKYAAIVVRKEELAAVADAAARKREAVVLA
jgi:hypothetical protein